LDPRKTGGEKRPQRNKNLAADGMAPFSLHHPKFQMYAGWWCNNHLEKYEFVNGKDDIPYMKWKIKNV